MPGQANRRVVMPCNAYHLYGPPNHVLATMTMDYGPAHGGVAGNAAIPVPAVPGLQGPPARPAIPAHPAGATPAGAILPYIPAVPALLNPIAGCARTLVQRLTKDCYALGQTKGGTAEKRDHCPNRRVGEYLKRAICMDKPGMQQDVF